MNFVVFSLIILLGLSQCSARGIPNLTRGFRNWPYIPIPASDEVWREPVFGKSPFLGFDNEFDLDIEENDPSNNNGGPEKHDDDDNQKQKDLDKDDKDVKDDLEEDNIKYGEEEDEKDQNEDEENVKINEEKDEEDHVGKDDDNMPNEGKKDPVNNENPSFLDRELSLHNPFFNLKKITNYLKELERSLENVYKQTMEEASLLNGTYTNTTEEKVDVNGQKYLVQKSVIKTGDNSSSIYIETVDVLPETETNRTKRSNFYAERAQKAKESDP